MLWAQVESRDQTREKAGAQWNAGRAPKWAREDFGPKNALRDSIRKQETLVLDIWSQVCVTTNIKMVTLLGSRCTVNTAFIPFAHDLRPIATALSIGDTRLESKQRSKRRHPQTQIYSGPQCEERNTAASLYEKRPLVCLNLPTCSIVRRCCRCRPDGLLAFDTVSEPSQQPEFQIFCGLLSWVLLSNHSFISQIERRRLL